MLRLARTWLPVAALAVIALYVFAARSAGAATANRFGWPALVVLALPLVWQTTRQAMHGEFATDAIASISIITSLVLRQPLPGLIIVLMQSGGEALERAAQARAGRALALLEAAAPRVALLWLGNASREVPIADVRPGDHLLIPPGEIVPADATVDEGESDLDTATITGEPLPFHASPGSSLLSGYINGGSALIVTVKARAADSQYERIVQLVKSAQDHKAPIQRLADRYAVWFTPFVVAAAIATYLVWHDSARVLALLVIATPCPLILAAPVAIIGGINSAARHSILFRNGTALETLGTIRAAIFDKTGTLTVGRPAVAEVVVSGDVERNRMLALVAGLEVGSAHALAAQIVAFVRDLGIEPLHASDSHEEAGQGIRGSVDGNDVAIGSRAYITRIDSSAAALNDADTDHEVRSWIALNGHVAGFVRYHDVARPDLPAMIRRLREAGIVHIEILSGDEAGAVDAIASTLDVDGSHARLRPDQKLEQLARVRGAYGATAMIGDGTNDAPALAAADVGIAVTARGGGIAAETADVILLGDDLSHIPDGILIARRTLRIARQSIVVGLLLSVCGMVAAAFGLIAAVPAAVLQEVIDVAVIINALRATRSVPRLP